MAETLYCAMEGGILPTVKYTSRVHVGEDYVHIRRRLEEFVLYYIVSGEMHLREGDRCYDLRENDMLILEAGAEHWGVRGDDCEYYYVHFYHRGLRILSEDSEHLKNRAVDSRLRSLMDNACSDGTGEWGEVLVPKYIHVGHPASAAALHECLVRLVEAQHNRLEHFRLKASCILMEYLLAMSREMTGSFLGPEGAGLTSRSTRLVHNLLAYLQENYARDITGAALTARFECSYDHMNRLFKKTTGSTITAFLNRLRISKAQQLLADGSCRLADVAERCGFHDIYYFSKVFKKIVGISPGAYARRDG